ncbi:MAG: chemotaxis protein CheW [Desulfuromonadaceae bacterium]|nr:chemotaxis protein CheW [Desulfuromonadaceae bacterium]
MEKTSSDLSNQYLTFTLDDEIFALEIGKAREVLDVSEVTRIPQMPDYMCGVINLRGSVVPVIDMRKKFGLSAAQKTIHTCIIIVEVTLDNQRSVLGALVDSVQEVLELDTDSIELPPRLGASLNTEFLHGMGRHGERFIMLLNIDRVFSSADLALIHSSEALTQAEAV